VRLYGRASIGRAYAPCVYISKNFHIFANSIRHHQKNLIMHRILLIAAILFLIKPAFAQHGSEALQQWYDNKYSMFIHFGVYSDLGGVWKGNPVTVGYSEQIQAHGGIMSDTYEELASLFNPAGWNADSIAILAKAAGMRSIVITSKHHDGFCMYHSAHTSFNIVDATRLKRDILKELSEACARHGLNMGLYFSLVDWTIHPWTTHNANPIAPAHHDLNKKQVAELLTNYGPISELWFDMGSLTEKQSTELYDLVKQLQPGCMVSGRLGNNQYDFCVMGDNEYPDFKIDAPWQTPASIFNETWGYRSWQKRENLEGKIREKLLSLIKVVSRGGNYLLNIGPKGDGTVVEYEARVLKGIGEWLEVNGEAIYETSANPFPAYYPWGEITARDNTVYLILSGEPVQQIELPLLSGKVISTWVPGEPGLKIFNRIQRQSVIVNIPQSLYMTSDIRVVAIKFSDDFQAQPEEILDTRLTWLGYRNAIRHYSYSCIDYYNNHPSVVKQSWNFTVPRAETTPEIFYTAGEIGKELELKWNGETEIIQLTGKDPLPVTGPMSEAVWKDRYVLGPVRSSFDRIHGPTEFPIDPSKEWGRNFKWELQTQWVNNSEEKFSSRPREAYYVLQEIEAGTDHTIITSLHSGDGIQVWLNGKIIAMHNNPRNSLLNHDVVLLPLNAGKNQLLIKIYNRFGYRSSYKIDTRPEQVIYGQKLMPRQLNRRGINKLEMKLHQPKTPHDPIKLNNIRIEL
jgi:alpha-L-fucosidase